MTVYGHLDQRITLLGNLRQMTAVSSAGVKNTSKKRVSHCPTILVAGNNSATIAAVEHASPFALRLIHGVPAFK
jgi:hypothetical protein